MNPHRTLALLLVLLAGAAAPAISAPPAQTAGTILYAAPYGPGECTGWYDACDLQYALYQAKAGDEVWVMAGEHRPTTGLDRTATFQLINGVAIYGGFAGDETDRDDRDWIANQTILSGNIGDQDVIADNAYHVVTGSGTDGTAVLDGFTVTGGYADIYGPFGGGMYNVNASPTVRNVTFTENDTFFSGGGMYNIDSSPTLENVIFISNLAQFGGGGLYNMDSSPTLKNVTFISNSTQSDGGGMYNSHSSPTLENVTFIDNTAVASGGGMYNDFSSKPTLKNVTFSGNTAKNHGGGMYNGNSSSPTIINAIFRGNTAEDGGPQVFNDITISTLANSVVEGGCPVNSNCTNVWDQDPLLGVLGNWGGATPTIPLLPGSAAIDAGDNNFCPSTDQRGVERPAGFCDIGAFEARFTLEIEIGSNQSAPIYTPFAKPLVVRVNSDYGEPVDGGVVTFSAPASGPGAVPQENKATISGGLASLSAAANGIPGSYQVAASAAGAALPARFSLTNIVTCYLPIVAAGN